MENPHFLPSYLKSTDVAYIDELFARYLEDPNSIDPSWRYFFDGLEVGAQSNGVANGVANGHANGHTEPQAAKAPAATAAPSSAQTAAASTENIEHKVADLIQRYRDLGRLLADVNPLMAPPQSHPMLEPSSVRLKPEDLGKTYNAGKLIGLGPAPFEKIVQHLKATYCETIAVEIAHIQNPEAREWLQKRMEAERTQEDLGTETRQFILKRLTESECFEKFLHTRYVAQKRFSIEGGEGTIPALDCIIETGAQLGAEQFCFGMAHRGRLNVLTNIFGKKPEQIFTEFEGTYKIDLAQGEGDVKYHKGYSADFTTRQGKKTHLTLASNPSHLEFINPVVEGIARAKQDKLGDSDRSKVIPILIHGDAAFAGQGVCYETLNLSQLAGYATGGTIHLVINNQVGFTAIPEESRSTQYATDLGKMLDGPIFHVNGDDPEAIWYVAKLCTEFRQKFKQDVFIDIVCYRKHGHNEGDEPSFTQPLMYKLIKGHPTPREVYAKRLAAKGTVPIEGAQTLVDETMARLSQAQAKAKAESPQPHVSVFEGEWKGLRSASEQDCFAPVSTRVEAKTLAEIAERINTIPEGFHVHPKLTRFFDARLNAVREGKGIDWGGGEALAFGSLLLEGHCVRLSGQDAERGTFSHRHSVLHDVETGELYYPFNHIREGQARYDVYNSHLSEAGVLGFEYGYSLAAPQALTIWEAQFGDFANGAQVIIDQFIVSGESKWQRASGIVLLLPHGYEGQGPEHSSARLDRFLNLCGRNNICVANLTTPAQIFHALRRQILRDFRKPLVIMSPKSLLRHPQAVSDLSEFTQGEFHEVIDDPAFPRTPEGDAKARAAKRILLCTGKVYYDILAERIARKMEDVAVIRVEQIYPWPADALAQTLARYPGAKQIIWTQEEPRNMGAWSFVFNQWTGGLGFFQSQAGGRPIRYAGRQVGAAPAVGSPKLHEQEQKALLEQAFEGLGE